MSLSDLASLGGLVSVVSFVLTVIFATVWGAHAFETAALYLAWIEDFPKSFLEFLATRSAKKGGMFWRRLVPCLYLVSLIAVILAVVAGLRTNFALALAGACGLTHLTMIILIFAPTNTKLGFYGGPGIASLDPHVAKTLLLRWGRWNFVRLGFEATGLIAALLAFRAA
jgi:hypothetical protein